MVGSATSVASALGSIATINWYVALANNALRLLMNFSICQSDPVYVHAPGLVQLVRVPMACPITVIDKVHCMGFFFSFMACSFKLESWRFLISVFNLILSPGL